MHPTAPDQADLESQLGSLLRSGRAAGFSSERFDLCLRLIAQVPSPASQKAWFDDYLPIHDWLDSTKESFADFRHRALRHHSQGIFEAERVFGHAIRNADGKLVPVRYIAEQHVREDCVGFIPTVADWFRNIKPESWMSQGYRIEPAAQDGPEQRESVNVSLTAQSQLPAHS